MQHYFHFLCTRLIILSHVDNLNMILKYRFNSCKPSHRHQDHEIVLLYFLFMYSSIYVPKIADRILDRCALRNLEPSLSNNCPLEAREISQLLITPLYKL